MRIKRHIHPKASTKKKRYFPTLNDYKENYAMIIVKTP